MSRSDARPLSASKFSPPEPCALCPCRLVYLFGPANLARPLPWHHWPKPFRRWQAPFGAAIASRYWFLWVRCPACRSTSSIDLRKIDRHPDAAVSSLILTLSCRSCRPNAPFASLCGYHGPASPTKRARSIAGECSASEILLANSDGGSHRPISLRFSSYSARSISPLARRRLRTAIAVERRAPDVRSATQTIMAANPTKMISRKIRPMRPSG